MNTLFIHSSLKGLICSQLLMFFIITGSTGQSICVERKDKVPITGKDIFFCEGKSISLSAKLCVPVAGAVKFRWTYLEDTYISTTLASVTITFTGPWEIVATLPSGVIYKDTFNIKYFVSPFFEIITNPLPLKCEGVPLTLKATKSNLISSYHWFTSADTTALSRTDTLFDVLKDTTYIVEALDKNRCLVADTFQVVQSPFVPKVNIGPKDTVVCEGTTIELKNLLADNYDHFWNTGETDALISVYQSGKYWLKVRNTFRCTATDTINVLVVPSPKITAGKNFYSCYGSGVELGIQLNSSNQSLYQFEWTPNQNINNNRIPNPVVTPISNTRYKVRVYTKAGCEDTSSVYVVINPKLTASVNTQDTSVCLGKSITLRGNASGGTPDPSQTTAYTFAWKPGTGLNNVSGQNVVARPLTTTRYTLFVKDAQSCYDSIGILVNISTMTAKIQSSKTIDACQGDTILLKNAISGGIAPFTFLWSSNNQLIKDSTSGSLSVQAQNTGALGIKLNITDKSGCTAGDTLKISVNGLPVLGNIAHNLKICVGDTMLFSLNATGGSGTGYTFPWSPDHTIANAGTANPEISGLSENIGFKTFLVRVVDSKSCSSKSDTLILQTVPDYQVRFGKPDTSACQGTVIGLGATDLFNKGLLFSWTKNEDTNPFSTDSVIVVTSPGQYKLRIKNPSTGCASAGIKNIDFIFPPSNPIISSDNQVCNNSQVQLLGTATGKELSFEWSASGSGNLSETNATKTWFTPLAAQSGNVTINLSVKNACGKSDTSRNLQIYPSPALNITTQTGEYFIDSLIQFSCSSSPAAQIQWDFRDGTSLSAGLDPTHSFHTENIYFVRAMANDANGCQMQDSVKIMIVEGIKIKEIYIPNVFSPLSSNTDNNSLKIFGKNISPENFTFRIYNKWGEVIYQTENLSEAKEQGWNGNFLNADQPVNVGLYTYTVKGKFTDGTPIEKAGSATLLK
jgi:hypothetical protein